MLNSQRLTLIHTIRGLASLFVVICHSKLLFWVGGTEFTRKFPQADWNILDYLIFGLDMMTSNGTAMVVIFFVLSGFFIAYSFDKNNWPLKDFYFNRFLRIYIPFFVSLLFATAVFYFIVKLNPGIINNTIKSELAELFKTTWQNFDLSTFLNTVIFKRNGDGIYMAMNFPYWSLYHEALFYIVAPIAVKYYKQAFSVSLALFIYSFTGVKYQAMYMMFIFDYLVYFMLGIFMYYIIIRNNIFKVPKLLFVGTCFLLLALTMFSPHFIGHKASFIFGAALAIILINYFMYYDVQNNVLIDGLKFLGKISYSMYLFHMPIFVLLFGLLNLVTGKFMFFDRIYWLAVIIVVIASVPIYYIVEDKSLKLISAIKKKKLVHG